MARILIADGPFHSLIDFNASYQAGNEVAEEVNDGLEALKAYHETNPEITKLIKRPRLQLKV